MDKLRAMHLPRLAALAALAVTALAALLAAHRSAAAQPGNWSAPPPPPTLQLSESDYQLLERGEISNGEYVAGALLGSFGGFGIGHAIQGRWTEKGWVFTVADTASTAFLMTTLVSCSIAASEERAREDRCVAGFILSVAAYTGFRIWETVDLWVAPPRHNRRLYDLQRRMGYRSAPSYGFFVAPTGSSSGVAGLSLRF
jgi:hypothetical protein